MPLLFAILGAALLVSAILNTQSQLGTLLAADMPGYLKWAAALIVIGAIGAVVPEARGVSRALLGLVILVIFLTSGSGFFTQFAAAVQSPVAPTATTLPTPQGALPVAVTVSGGTTAASGAAGAAGAAGSAVSAIPGIATLLGL
jgi:hypothetical protein